MPGPAVPTEDFIAAWERHGGKADAVAADVGVTPRAVFQRRARIEEAGYELPAGAPPIHEIFSRRAYTPMAQLSIDDGSVVVFSDRHWWPGDGITHAEAAMLALLPVLRPVAVIANGDVLDGAAMGKHPPLGWERKPDAAAELGALVEGMGRIEAAAGGARLIRTVGNHDRRFDYYLAQRAPDTRGIVGTRLRDHLPRWEECWSAWVNHGDPGATVIKHRLGRGVTAARSNALKSGITIVTGDTHALEIYPIQDYRGRRWSVQCGMLGWRDSPAFEYGEQGPNLCAPGFAVLTWVAGVLQPPELAETDEAGVTWFRGRPIALRYRVRAGSRPIEKAHMSPDGGIT